jgi:hypothetical protein
MTELPPPAEPADPETTDDELDDPWHDQIVEVADDYGAPDVQALVAFVLGVGSLWGFSLLNGSVFFYLSVGPGDSVKTANVLSALLGAAFALLPVVLGWRASARVLDSDPRWVPTAARAAVILGLLAVVLRLVVAVLAAAAQDPVNRFGGF